MSFLDVAKNQITSQIAGRVNKAIHGGLKNVSGNLPGSSVGKGSNSSNSAAMQQKTRFTTKNITYPINVEGDPMQGHYIMFMINEANSATLHAEKIGMTAKGVSKKLGQEASISAPASRGNVIAAGIASARSALIEKNQVKNFRPQDQIKGGGKEMHSLTLKNTQLLD